MCWEFSSIDPSIDCRKEAINFWCYETFVKYHLISSANIVNACDGLTKKIENLISNIQEKCLSTDVVGPKFCTFYANELEKHSQISAAGFFTINRFLKFKDVTSLHLNILKGPW